MCQYSKTFPRDRYPAVSHSMMISAAGCLMAEDLFSHRWGHRETATPTLSASHHWNVTPIKFPYHHDVTPLRTLHQHSHLFASAYIFIRLAISLRRPQVLGGGQCSRTALPVSSATNIDIHFTLASQFRLYISAYEIPNHSSGLSSNHCQTIIYLKMVKYFLYKNNYQLFSFPNSVYQLVHFMSATVSGHNLLDSLRLQNIISAFLHSAPYSKSLILYVYQIWAYKMSALPFF